MFYHIIFLVPSGPPVNITVANASLTTVNITWLPPDPIEANGIITGYIVQFRRVEIKETVDYYLPPYQTYFFKNGT